MTSAQPKAYRLAELLPPSRIVAIEGRDKTRALQQLLDVLASTGAIAERVAVERAIMSREVLMSTGVGYGIAVPHAKLGTVTDFALALGIAQDGVAYSSVIDDQPVKLLCMIVGPTSQDENYLRILKMVMRFLKSEKGKILSAFSLDEVHGHTLRYDTAEDFGTADQS